MHPATAEVTDLADAGDLRRLRAAATGDATAFGDIAESRLPAAFRLAAAIVGSEAGAADATQNTLVAAWRELPRLRDLGRFDIWFRRVLVNECRMHVRRRSRVRGLSRATEQGRPRRRDATEATTLDREAVLDLLDEAFERLDPDDRAMVVLHHLEDRPLSEIAACLHMPVGTVKWRLHEARRTLHEALEAIG
jgi:RNA polymerase sigma-70 factor, ECF subfamily